MEEQKKKCFVITPIGNNDTDIRRHIDGIIDQSIIPALKDKYDIEVAHRKYEIGSINDRVIGSVYDSELVIANLTTLNPNVMYELAIRHSFGKPAIVIAEDGTKLPFDITDENTIFYINDPQGANDLKERIIDFEKSIDFKNKNYGPVHKAIGKNALFEEVKSNREISDSKKIDYIMDRIDSITNSFKFSYEQLQFGDIEFIIFEFDGEIDRKKCNARILNSLNNFRRNDWEIVQFTNKKLRIHFFHNISKNGALEFVDNLNFILESAGAKNIRVMFE